MSCTEVSKLCNNIVISQDVAFTDGNLVINIPQDTYENHHKYCLIIAQDISGRQYVHFDLCRCVKNLLAYLEKRQKVQGVGANSVYPPDE